MAFKCITKIADVSKSRKTKCCKAVMSWGNSPYLFCVPILVGGCKALVDMSLYASVPNCIKETPDHLKTQKMCNKEMHIISSFIFLIPDHFKTQKMCIKPIERGIP